VNRSGKSRSRSRLLHEAGFQADGDTIHFAGDFVIAIAQTNGLGFRAALEDLRTAELQIFDEDDAVAIREHVAVGVLDHARAGGEFRFGGAFPLMATRDAFPFVGEFQNLSRLAHRAGGFAHKEKA
jgi:hypothetical protein